RRDRAPQAERTHRSIPLRHRVQPERSPPRTHRGIRGQIDLHVRSRPSLLLPVRRTHPEVLARRHARHAHRRRGHGRVARRLPHDHVEAGEKESMSLLALFNPPPASFDLPPDISTHADEIDWVYNFIWW